LRCISLCAEPFGSIVWFYEDCSETDITPPIFNWPYKHIIRMIVLRIASKSRLIFVGFGKMMERTMPIRMLHIKYSNPLLMLIFYPKYLFEAYGF